MSRPQFNQPAQGVMYGDSGGRGVVNGGLIDFHDNGVRGVPVDFNPSVNAPAVGHSVNHAWGAGSALQGCYSGPPSFLTVNGVTYKPVDADVGAQSYVNAAQASPAPGNPAPAELVHTKVLSEEELNAIVDNRVRERVDRQVNGYLTRRGRHDMSPSNARAVDHEYRYGRGDSGRITRDVEQRDTRIDVEDEYGRRDRVRRGRSANSDDTIEQVRRANASMRSVEAGMGMRW
jgi:hypothetical protein